jgi:hypothetical protein
LSILNDCEAQDPIERSDIKRLLGLQHLLRGQLMFAVSHRGLSKARYLDAN